MDWKEIVVKIGVGACLGFGIIVLAKLAGKKNNPENRPQNPEHPNKQGPSKQP